MNDLLIFDGDCGICTYSSEFVLKRSIDNSIDVKPYQILNLKDLHNELNEERTSKSLFLLTKDGKLYNRSKGVFETMKRMRGIYKPLGYILSNPVIVFLANPIYDWVSRNRTKISIKFGLNACNISNYT
ncbi:MAG: DUF393 domain-containing protein [Ignavibacteriae bacterium]|nr:DUF393 domain-containing protein [Ignavibacteriota bacterium]